MIAISLKNITKIFPGVRALNDVSFDIAEGEVHCIIGENGAGKSTLIKILAGVQQLDSGEMEMFGEKVSFRSPEESKKFGIGVVYQELSNFLHLDVASNLFVNNFPKKNARIDYKKMYGMARESLDRLGLSHINGHSLMSDLSLGSQQMIEIAGLVNKNARVVIFDEPTSALTEDEVQKLFDLIKDLKASNVTIVYISHRLDEVLALADTVTVLKDGEHVITMPMSKDVTKNMLVKHMVGRDVNYDFKVGSSEVGEVLLDVEHLSSGSVLRDISFELRSGEILGIAGLEGSGRTELLETLFGWRRRTGGKVKIRGKEINIRNPIHAKANKLAYMTKERKTLGLFLGLDVKNNIAAASTQKYVKKGLVNFASIEKNAERYINAMHIKCSDLSQKVMNLSGGNQQKVLLSMWMAADPDILMIDEPTRGVDVGAKTEIHILLRDIASQGKAVIIVSSELQEIIASCDRVIVMYEGEMKGTLANKDLSEVRLMHLASGI